jgi:hypothetical protein
VWGQVCGFFLVNGFEKAYGAQIQFKKLEGGILRRVHLEKVHLLCPENSLLDSLEVEEVDTGLKIKDLIKREDDFEHQVFLRKTLIRLKKSIQFEFLKPHKLFNHALTFGEFLRFDHGTVIFSHLKDIFLFIQHISYQENLDRQGNPILKILARTPRQGYQNQIFVSRDKDETRIVITDYALSQFSKLIPNGFIEKGELNGEICLGSDGVSKANLSVKELKIKFDSGDEVKIQIKLSYQKGEQGKWSCRIEKIKFNIQSLEIDTTLDLKGRFTISDKIFRIDGMIKIKDFFINQTPFPSGEGTLDYDSQTGILEIDYLRFGEEYQLKGKYHIFDRILDLECDFINADLSRLQSLVSCSMEGKLDGFIRLSGDPNFPRWEGQLNCNKGQVCGFAFEEARFGMIGFGPEIELKHSKLLTSSGQWLVSGVIDFKKTKPFKNVKFSMDPEQMGIHGFEISKEDKELTLKKQINRKLAVSLKARSLYEDPLMAERDADTEVQLEYEYHPNQDVVFRMDENEQMVGLRKKLEF